MNRRVYITADSWAGALVGLPLLVFVLTGNTPVQATVANPAVSVSITESGFDPPVVTVTVGTTVMWTNHTQETVRLVSGEPCRIYLPLVLRNTGSTRAAVASPPQASAVIVQQQDNWGNVDIAPGESYAHTFATPGDYLYFLAGRPDRTGLVVTTPDSYTVNCDQEGGEEVNCCTDYPLYSLCFYMSPSGSNANDGLTEANAVATLDGVQDAINAYINANGPIDTHIEVRIKYATYVQQQAVSWEYYTPGYYTYFMPSDYKWGAWGSFAGRPIFSGLGTEQPWFILNGWPSGLDGPGDWTRMAFYYLEVRNYAQAGIVFDGPTNSQDKWNGLNYVYGMYFSHLGTKWAFGEKGYAGVFLANSRSNFIKNNHFVNLENKDGPNQADIHAVYMKNWSSNNLISDNSMYKISGDPIRVRHESNDNEIRSNVMYHTGATGQYSDFYQDIRKVFTEQIDCNAHDDHDRQECPSWRNWFRYNTVECGYSGEYIPHFYFFGTGTQDQNRDCVPSGCIDPGDDRVATASNNENCLGWSNYGLEQVDTFRTLKKPHPLGRYVGAE